MSHAYQPPDSIELTNTRIQDEYCHVGLDSLADLYHLLEELAFLFMPSRSINNDDLKSLLLELGYTLSRDSHRVGFGVRTEVRYFGFRSGLPSLIESTGSESVSANDA